MTRTAPPQNAFSSGELDPLLHRRFDYQRFQTGLAKCSGFLPLPQGGFTRAPGTVFLGATKNNARAVLVPFVFAADDALWLEFTPLIMRVWRYGSLIMAGAVPFELATPYTAEDLDRLKWVQSADVTYMVDGRNPMQRLSRFALDSWTITDQPLNSGPFRTQNLDAARTIQASASTGAITLTANAAQFTAGHVGSLMRLTPSDNTTVDLWTSNEALTVGALRRYGENIYELTAGTNAGENPPIHSEGEARVDNAPTKWLYLSDGVGIVRITALASPTSASATVLKALPKGVVDVPTYRWADGAWSAIHGHPSSLELFDQRLSAAATRSEPRTVWFSAVGDFADFNPGVEADDPFAYTISGEGSVNRIQNLRSGRSGLHILALGQEHATRSETRAQVIGPTTAVFEMYGSYGSSPARPIAPDGNPIFITRDRRRVMRSSYSIEQDGNTAQNLSLPAQHFGAERFDQIVWQAIPQRIAWLRLGSGDLAAMLHDPQEEVLGWARVPHAGGFVESVAVVPNEDGSQDVLIMSVRREINGATVRTIEQQAATYGVLTGADPITDACHFFAATRFAPPAPETSFAMPHLIGQQVYAWTDAGEYGPLTVAADGNVTVPDPVTRAWIGLFDATHQVMTLDIQAASPEGNTYGRQKRLLSNAGIGLHRTAQGYVQSCVADFATAPRISAKQPLVPRRAAAPLTDAFTGLAEVPTPTGHGKTLCLIFTPHSGAPMTVTSLTPVVQEAGP